MAGTRGTRRGDGMWTLDSHVPGQGPPASPSRAPLETSGAAQSGDSCHFEQQEKVSVRLVQNRGLVVEEPENKRTCAGESVGQGEQPQVFDIQACYGMFEPATPDAAETCHQKPANCLKTRGRTSCPGHSSKTLRWKGGIRLTPSPLAALSDTNRDSLVKTHPMIPFSREGRDVSASGVSSFTPLMPPPNVESHTTPVPRPLSWKQEQGSRSNIHLYCALVLGFSASLFFSLTLLLAKVLKNRDHHPINIAFWRYLGIFLPSILLASYYLFRGKETKVLGSVWPIRDMDKAANMLVLLMRGILGSTAVILRFCSLTYLSIGDSSVISSCAPVFASIFAPLCMRKEKGGVVPLLSAGVTIFAVFLLCRPPFSVGTGAYEANILKGVFLASLSMLCSSGGVIAVRNLLAKVHFSLMIFLLGIWGVFEAGMLGISLEVLKVPDKAPDVVMLIGLGILTFFGHLFVMLAMRIGQSCQVDSSISVMRSCDICLSFLWQYLFLKTEPELLGILSGILVVLAIWCICLRKWLIKLRENSVMRQQLSLMLY